MTRLDSDRPATPLEDQLLSAIVEAYADTGEEVIDPKAVSEAVQAAVRAGGQAIAEELLATVAQAIASEEETRKGFESGLQQLWSPALERLQAFIIAASEAGETFSHERRKARQWGPLDEALVRIHARACLIAREVLTLLRAGYASGAHARWRSLHELAVTAFFLSEHGPDVAEAYLLHSTVSSWRAIPSYQLNAQALGYEPLAETEKEDLKREINVLSQKYGRSYLREWGWAALPLGKKSPTFPDIEDAVSMGHLRPYFHMANYAVHAGSKGLFFDLGAEASRGSVYLSGASNTGLSDPGQGAAIALLQTTAALVLSDVTAERALTLTALQTFADATIEAFASRNDEAERLVELHHGHAARRRVFARRAARGAFQAQNHDRGHRRRTRT